MTVPPQLKQNVERFAATFHGYVSKVEGVSLGPDDERYRKVLYFTILEGLAKARYRSRSAGEAFASFVVTYFGWSDGDRISLPHLVAALERTSDSDFEKVREWAFTRYRSWGSGGPLPLDEDPTKEQIQSLWPATPDRLKSIPELDLTWPSLQHRSLLYAYRSKLSHESREPSLSFGSMFGFMPHYNSVQVANDPIEWHLTYPPVFLASLCRSGVESLKSLS